MAGRDIRAAIRGYVGTVRRDPLSKFRHSAHVLVGLPHVWPQ